jgi:hypothetical protein
MENIISLVITELIEDGQRLCNASGDCPLPHQNTMKTVKKIAIPVAALAFSLLLVTGSLLRGERKRLFVR